MKKSIAEAGFPRTRGGVSIMVRGFVHIKRFSPHTRGCFLSRMMMFPPWFVFPAHAGVFPASCCQHGRKLRFPRTRGGVSAADEKAVTADGFSPHTRGCFLSYNDIDIIDNVFPAHAGVFLVAGDTGISPISFPRTRGGVSRSDEFFVWIEGFSPHTRGCFPRFR